MATRSSITVKMADGRFRSVYCHFDGYLDGVGTTLLVNYNTYEQALALVSIGDLSVLAESIECPLGHSFENQIKGYSVFYGRDRGEDDTEPFDADTYNEVMARNNQEYNYLFDDGEWKVFNKYSGSDFKTVDDALREAKDDE